MRFFFFVMDSRDRISAIKTWTHCARRSMNRPTVAKWQQKKKKRKKRIKKQKMETKLSKNYGTKIQIYARVGKIWSGFRCCWLHCDSSFFLFSSFLHFSFFVHISCSSLLSDRLLFIHFVVQSFFFSLTFILCTAHTTYAARDNNFYDGFFHAIFTFQMQRRMHANTFKRIYCHFAMW